MKIRKVTVSATVSPKAFEVRQKIKEKEINFSPLVEQLMFETAKKNGIKY